MQDALFGTFYVAFVLGMETLDGPTFAVIVATFLGPVLAVQAQKRLEEFKARRNRKEQLFRTLMATRLARLAPEHVQALNLIDFDFFGSRGKDKKVLDAWNLYRDHLNTSSKGDGEQVWLNRQNELFHEMLYQMSECLGYGFDKVQIRKSAYSPMAHGNLEDEQTIIRRGMVDLFSAKFAIPVVKLPSPQTDAEIQQAREHARALKLQEEAEAKAQAEFRELLAKQIRGETPYKVEIVRSQKLD
jgi:hypothetical protein